MKKLLLILMGIILISLSSADIQLIEIKFIFGDITPPIFNNCRNFTHYLNNSFNESITAEDESNISAYYLNDTFYFNVNENGTIINITELNEISKHYLNLSVNDTFGNTASCLFYIDVQTEPRFNIFDIDFSKTFNLVFIIFLFILAGILFYFKYFIWTSLILIILGFMFLINEINIIISVLIIALGIFIAFVFKKEGEEIC